MNDSGHSEGEQFIVFMVAIVLIGSLLTGATDKAKRWLDQTTAQLKGEGKQSASHCKRPRALDGDTITAICEGRRVTVRLYGIDTPESKRPGVPVECQANAASDSMKTMLSGQRSVRLVADPTQDSTDRYGRTLAYAEAGGKDVGRAQLSRGFARVYVFKHKRVQRDSAYRKAERSAKRQRLGIWRYCGGSNHAPL